MAWVVIASGGSVASTTYSSEEEAERAAWELARTTDEDTWVAIADPDAHWTRIIKIGDDD
jgi:hypothetical protein